MDLTILKQFFDACQQSQSELEEYWSKFSKQPAYSLFKLIAPLSQPKLDATLIRQFLISFNWQALISPTTELQQRPLYKIHSFNSQMNPEQLLDYGLSLLVNSWGSNKALTFEHFCLLIKGQEELPSKDKEIPFPKKKQLFQCIMNQIQHLLKLQSLKRVVYNEYRNLSDLFEIITSNKLIQLQNINHLFLSFSIRKTDKELKMICRRARIPWDFQHFVNQFKKNSQTKSNEHKVYYSSARKKKNDNLDEMFTTPTKQKQVINQSSTKLSKNALMRQSVYATPTKLHTFSTHQFQSQDKQNQANKYKYVQILADLLKLQEQFINLCDSLVKRKDFDLELVYEKHGKKFQKILNQRYGVCNFSAFVRFIIPRHFEHRYLSFIRYEPQNQLTEETEKLIDNLLMRYEEKQKEIEGIWKRCDKQMLLRHFCQPKEKAIPNQRLNEIFSARQTKIILERLDPHQIGQISIEALN